jgi:hypothetical protein
MRLGILLGAFCGVDLLKWHAQWCEHGRAVLNSIERAALASIAFAFIWHLCFELIGRQ